MEASHPRKRAKLDVAARVSHLVVERGESPSLEQAEAGSGGTRTIQGTWTDGSAFQHKVDEL